MSKHDDHLIEARKIAWYLMEHLANGDVRLAQRIVTDTGTTLHTAGKWDAVVEQRHLCIRAALETLAAEQSYVTHLISVREGNKDGLMEHVDELETTLRQANLMSDETAFRLRARRWALDRA